ncbi:hypothetical protein BH10BAC3_BH10BAC3_09830 [soil metagenome]
MNPQPQNNSRHFASHSFSLETKMPQPAGGKMQPIKTVVSAGIRTPFEEDGCFLKGYAAQPFQNCCVEGITGLHYQCIMGTG